MLLVWTFRVARRRDNDRAASAAVEGRIKRRVPIR